MQKWSCINQDLHVSTNVWVCLKMEKAPNGWGRRPYYIILILGMESKQEQCVLHTCVSFRWGYPIFLRGVNPTITIPNGVYCWVYPNSRWCKIAPSHGWLIGGWILQLITTLDCLVSTMTEPIMTVHWTIYSICQLYPLVSLYIHLNEVQYWVYHTHHCFSR